MSYRTPQRIINKEFAARAKGASDIQTSLENSTVGIMNIVKDQKAETEKVIQNNIEKESALRDKINEFSTPGASNMDNSIVGFWEPKIQAYVDNMNMAANGEITQREAMIRNKQIENLIPQFKANAGTFGLEAARLKEAAQNGTLSTTGSTSNKKVLDRINNNGDVQIVEQDGAIYYWAPDRDEDGNIIGEFDPKTSNFINGSKLAANPEQSLFNSKADISGLISQGWTKFSQEDTGISPYVNEEAFTNGDKHPVTGEIITGLEDGYEQVIRWPNQKEGIKNDFVGDVESSAYLNNIVGNEKEMLSVWQDLIPDGELGEDGQYPPNSLGFFASGGDPTLDINLEEMGYVGPDAMEQWQNSVYGEYPDNVSPEQKALIDKTQKAVSKRYMANKMWDQNAISRGGSKSLGKRKIQKPQTNASTSTDNTKSMWELTKNNQKGRTKFEVTAKKRDNLQKKFQFLPETIDADTIAKVEADMGFAPGDFADQEGKSKAEFETFLLGQIGVDEEFEIIEDSKIRDDVKKAKPGSTIIIKGKSYKVTNKNGKNQLVPVK